MNDDITNSLSRVTEALIALSVSTNPYDILLIYEDIEEKVNSLFRAKWESLETHKEE